MENPEKGAGGARKTSDKAHKVRGKVFIRKELCKGCSFCVSFCPRQTLVMSRNINAKGYHYPEVDKDNCTGCDLCGMLCPDFAIYGIKLQKNSKP